MTLPEEVRAGVEAAHAGRGRAHSLITAVRPVGGGCITPAVRVDLSDGTRYFLKFGGPETPESLFRSEANGLEALAAPGVLHVPAVIAVHDEPGDVDCRWILLEWIEPGPATPAAWRQLGAGLARLHQYRNPRHGWDRDNFIGSLPQRNGWFDSWAEFWRDRRLRPQLLLAERNGYFSGAERARFRELLDRTEELLAGCDEDGASLLHGDLWSGNVHFASSRSPALVDPSTYFGHREVDLAMSELFGGFDRAFYQAYNEAWPILDGYRERRRALYQLYYLLVHVNLFGAGYVAQCLARLRALLA